MQLCVWVEPHFGASQGTGGTGLRGVLEKVAYSNPRHAIRNASRLNPLACQRCFELWAHAEIANPWFDRNMHKHIFRTAIVFLARVEEEKRSAIPSRMASGVSIANVDATQMPPHGSQKC